MTAQALWLTFFTALVASIVLSPVVRRLAVSVGMVDRPDPRKVHAVPMPLLGGVAIHLSIVIALIVACIAYPGVSTPLIQAPAAFAAIIVGATLLLVVGLLDDAGRLHHQIKLMVAMPVAAIGVLATGTRLHVFEAFPFGVVPDAVISFVWIVGITAAFSILDHMDGLCAGIGAIAAAAFCVIGSWSGDAMSAVVAAALAGAGFGFLRINFNPARMFMGDAGAMCIGFLSAVLGLRLAQHSAFDWTLALPLLVLIVPLLDTSLVIVSRSRRGLIPFSSPGKDHTAHRLSNLGLGHRRAVVVLYGIALAGGAAAVWAVRSGGSLVRWAILSALVAGAAAILWLESVPYERQSKSK